MYRQWRIPLRRQAAQNVATRCCPQQPYRACCRAAGVLLGSLFELTTRFLVTPELPGPRIARAATIGSLQAVCGLCRWWDIWQKCLWRPWWRRRGSVFGDNFSLAFSIQRETHKRSALLKPSIWFRLEHRQRFRLFQRGLVERSGTSPICQISQRLRRIRICRSYHS